jgi:hypothetical protein
MVKLTDFGIAHTAAAPAITAAHVLTGTPAYFAPETARGEGTDSRSDVYSLGATLYAAVEGHPPFGTDTGNVLALLARIGRGGAPVPQGAGPLTDLLRHLTADDPAARPTAAQAHDALRSVAMGSVAMGSVAAGPVAAGSGAVDSIAAGTGKIVDGRLPGGPPPAGLDVAPTAARSRRGLRVAAAVVAVLVAVAGVIVAVVVSRPGTDPAATAAPVAAPTTTVPDTATIADPATADPCSLLDVDSVKGFGATTLDADNVSFAGCRADIARPDGGAIGFTIAFESQVEAAQFNGGTRAEEDGYTVVRYPPGEGFCERRILLADGNAVLASAVRYEDPTGTTDLCAIADAGRAATLARLVRDGIGRRIPLSDTSPLAGIPACSLLAAGDIDSGLVNATPARPGFGGWGCNWNSYTSGDSVAVTYYRGYVLGKSDGTSATFAGHPGTVLAREGNCWVQFVQRSYTAAGSNRVEAVWVTYWGSGTGDQLCRTATALAAAAAGRLPPPS